MSISVSQGIFTSVFPLQLSHPGKDLLTHMLVVIRLHHLFTSKGSLIPCLEEYNDVFDKINYSSLPAHCPSDLRIKLLPVKTPTWGKVYHNTHFKGIILNEYFSELFAKRFMRRSPSPFSSPIFFVKKAE